MEPEKKFRLDEHKPQRELFRVGDDYFEKLPVNLADRLHAKRSRRKWLVPLLSLGSGAIAAVLLIVLLVQKPSSGPVETASGKAEQGFVTSLDIYRLMVQEDEFAPTEDELIEQLASLEDDSEKKAIEEYLDEQDLLYEDEIFEGI